ncbi:hypothetical protein KDD30_17610 (plasmid) [Photobacterium sp. GJ3]|uniref:hypothetical protein n=1 Tax=Photobacterium sp. GJ3 TaxID=2829502 RepID=UPI001B8B0127|nr:hypothetical protein [Photobacterium sp. GJ3]QUJ69976.1 hypothetical protein KDD30_17610 [Photobacterium sp. GJ3]
MKKIRKTISFTLSAIFALTLTSPVNASNTTDPQQAFMDNCLKTYHNESLCLGYALGVFHTVSAIQCHHPEQQTVQTLKEPKPNLNTEGTQRVRLSIEAMESALSVTSMCQGDTTAPI